VAAAIGQPLNIPILVRSLGQDMYRVGMTPDRAFRPGLELITYLDGNLSSNGLDDPALNVASFCLPWWTGSKMPTNSQSSYLSSTSIKSAINHYRLRLAEALIPFGVPHTISNLADELNKPAYTWHSSVNDDLPNCTRCRLYRSVALGVLDQLRDAHNMVHACEVANEAEKDIGIRRASGFNELYEAALKKEIEDPDSDSASIDQQSASQSGKGKGKEKQRFGPEVEALKKLTKQLVMQGAMASSKWTWGVDLTESDLHSLVRGADCDYRLPHSGYDEELLSASFISKTSDVLDPVNLEDPDDPNLWFDELSPSNTVVPELHAHNIPDYSEIMLVAADDLFDPEPDLVIEAFTKRAKAEAKKANKVLLQDEVDRPTSYADYGSEFVPQIALIPRRPWLMPRLPIILPPINVSIRPPNVAVNNLVNRPNVDNPDSDAIDHTDSDDIPDHIDIPKSSPSPRLLFPVSDDEQSNEMDVVSSDDIEIPMSVESSDSGSALDDIVFPESPITTRESMDVPGVMIGIDRDPNTGRFTAASFANFPDELLD